MSRSPHVIIDVSETDENNITPKNTKKTVVISTTKTLRNLLTQMKNDKTPSSEFQIFTLDLSNPSKSHKTNIFTNLDASDITKIIFPIMDDASCAGFYWKGRAASMLENALPTLIHHCKTNNEHIDFAKIKNAIRLQSIIDASNDTELPIETRESAKSYLASIPYYVPENQYDQKQATFDQHGYLEMQFKHILDETPRDISDIMTSSIPDFLLEDIMDKENTNKILEITIPPLEKDTHLQKFNDFLFGTIERRAAVTRHENK